MDPDSDPGGPETWILRIRIRNTASKCFLTKNPNATTYLIKEENAMLVERVAQLEEQLLGGEGDGQQQQQLRLQAEDHLLERSKLRSTESILS
jgi:hypothetical protein